MMSIDQCFVLDHSLVVKNIKDSVPSTVRMPYSLIPSIDFSSRAYQRALATLGKQVIADKSNDKRKDNDGKGSVGDNKCKYDSPHEFVSCSGTSNNDDVSSMDLGMSLYFLSPFSFTDFCLSYFRQEHSGYPEHPYHHG
jgi:hypothetical protein